MKDKVCKVKDCDRNHYAKGYCKTHYARLRNGIPIDGVIGKGGRRNTTGVPVYCTRCRYSWFYDGQSPYYATCPKCRTTIKYANLPEIDIRVIKHGKTSIFDEKAIKKLAED